MKNKRWSFYYPILILIFLSAASVLNAQTPSPVDSISPSPTPPTVNQPSDSQNIRTQPSPANIAPSPSNDKGLISPEMVTAIGGLWMWGVMLIICALLFIFRRELRSLVKKAEQAETIQIGAPGGVNLQIGRPLDTDKKVEPASSEEKAAPPSKPKEVSELTGTREPESLLAEKTVEDLRDELIEAFQSNDESKIQQTLETLQAATDDPLKRIANEAIYLHQRFRQGDTSAIAKLQKLTKQESAAPAAYYALGLCYEDANELEKALEAYRLSIERTEKSKVKAHRVTALADCILKAGRTLDAYKAVSSEIAKTNESKILLILYTALASLYEKSSNPLHQALALEKALEHEPNNTSLLFDLAYAYSEADLHPLSIFHYNTLLRFDNDNRDALNNLGVEYDNQQLPILSVESYKKASELNETLSSANLAYRLMNAGFAEEASTILENAKRQTGLHPNVGRALASLSEKQVSEGEKKDKLIDNARKQQYFLRAFSETYFQNLSNQDENMEGAWQLEDGTDVQVTQNESIVEANWLLTDKKHRFTGAVTNRTLRLTKKKMRYLWYNKAEESFEKEYEGYAYLSEDNQKLFIMYVHAGEPIFVTMIKKVSSEELVMV